MTTAELLAEARRMLDESPPGTVSAWPRAAAVLARQALEAAITDFWHAREPSIVGASMRAQIGCLHAWVSNDVAAETAWTWHALSHATHHHAYELDPTREELASLVASATQATAELAAAAGRAPVA